MGFSSSGGGDASSDTISHETAHATQTHPSFGDKLMEYIKTRYPVAGGLANMALGNGQASPPAIAPQVQAPEMPDYSGMISMNAQPKQSGGGLSTVLKLLAG